MVGLQDLRLGNIVDTLSMKGGAFLPLGKPYQITAFNKFNLSLADIKLDINNAEIISEIHVRDACGIPFTIPLLETIGFIKIHPSSTFSPFVLQPPKELSNQLTFQISLDGILTMGIGNEPIINMQYLHQLQNIYYSFTQKELNISKIQF